MSKTAGRFHKNKFYNADMDYNDNYSSKEFLQKQKSKFDKGQIRELRQLKNRDYKEIVSDASYEED